MKIWCRILPFTVLPCHNSCLFTSPHWFIYYCLPCACFISVYINFLCQGVLKINLYINEHTILLSSTCMLNLQVDRWSKSKTAQYCIKTLKEKPNKIVSIKCKRVVCPHGKYRKEFTNIYMGHTCSLNRIFRTKTYLFSCL